MKAVRRNVAADAHVFYDPKGKRWSVVKRLGLAVGLLASLAGVVLCITVLLLPVAPGNILDAYHFHPFNLQRPSRVEAAQAFMAQRLRFWVKCTAWPTMGGGWANRAATDLEYASQDN